MNKKNKLIIADSPGETSKFDLEQILKKILNKSDYEKVKIDWSSTFNKDFSGAQILNLGDNRALLGLEIEGTHWVSTFKNINSSDQSLKDGVYFDSYGLLPPTNVELAGFDYTPIHLQSYALKENFCGQWCCLFLKYCFEDDLSGFYSKFNNLLNIDLR